MPAAQQLFNTVGQHFFDVPPYVNAVNVTVNGAGGGRGSDPDGFESSEPGGNGGYIFRENYIPASDDTFDIRIGEAGGNANGQNGEGIGGTGWYDGGDGGEGTSNEEGAVSGAGGGGGGSTVVFLDGVPNWIAEGGGGSAGQRDGSGQVHGAGGGGGARGGEGGTGSDGGPGQDGAGTGSGGDGGDQDGDAGDGGGTDAYISFDESIVGGGNSGDASVLFEFSDRVDDLAQNTVVAGEVELTWSSVTDVTSYTIHRAQSSGSTTDDYTVIDTGVDANATGYADTTVENGERYYYRVENVNDYDNRLSNEVVVDTILPRVENPRVIETDQSQATIWWDEQDNSSDGVSIVQISDDGGSTWSDLDSVAQGVEEYVHDTTPGTYSYRIVRETDHVTADPSDVVDIEVFDPGAEINTDDSGVRDTDVDENNLTQP